MIDASLPDKSLPVKRADGERARRTRCGWKKGDGEIDRERERVEKGSPMASPAGT